MQEIPDFFVRFHLAQLTGQVVCSVVLATVFIGFWRSYRRAYLLLWSWSWWASAASIAATLLSVLLADRLGVAHPVRLSITAVSQVGAYWQAFLLLLGTRELLKRDTWSARLRNRGLVLLAILGIGAALAFVWDPAFASLRLAVRVSLRSAALGIGFVAGGLLVLSTHRGAGRLPPKLVGWAFMLYGANQLFYFALITVPGMRPRTPEFGLLTSISDLILPALMGGGMIAWLLDEERERVLQATARLEHMSLHDGLTSLPNRHLFEDRLHQALAMAGRRRDMLEVVALNVDDYHRFSDHLGLAYGDELLRMLSARALGALREGDTLARSSEHELGLVISGVANEQDASRTLAAVLDALRPPLRVYDRELRPSLTGGASLYPAHGSDTTTLLEAARRAMATAEREMRGAVKLYDPATDSETKPPVAFADELATAFANHEFCLHYQPIVEVRTGRITAVEALMRWARPGRDLVLPGEFIGDLESMGLGKEITVWAVRTALQETAAILADGPAGLTVAVNLSPPVCQNPDFPRLIESTLREVGIPRHGICLELTERAAMRGGETVLAVLQHLKRLGIQIAIDDFGTGYSSLRYLREFPVDMIKIDGSFVRGIRPGSDDAALCAAIVTLAHSLRLTVTAEGVELEDQVRVLAASGCDFLQGFAIGRPGPAEQLADLLRSTQGMASPAIRHACATGIGAAGR
jgi:diguanylate cyclase (GGDEF)-like protein